MAASFSLFLLMFLPPAVFAFLGQLVGPADARHGLRRWTAGLWVALIAGLATWTDNDGHWLGIFLFMLMALGLSFLVAYAGAVVGSSAALRLRRFRRA